MADIKYFSKLIDDGIAAIEFPATVPELYDPGEYMLSIGGKRIRPLLTLISNDMFSGNVHKALKPAMALEIFHNFTLIHDDLMDNAPIRRGKATVFRKWDANTAILSGDVLLVIAYELLTTIGDNKLLPALKIFNETAKGVCEGQQLDMVYEKRSFVAINDYLNMIRLKTALLIAGCLEMGALLAGASEADLKLIYNIGIDLGFSFQLQDDLLDSYGNADNFGKSIGGDIVANKKTYLTLKALELAEKGDKTRLQELYSGGEFSSREKIAAVTGIYEKTGVRKYAEELRDKYFEGAMKKLDELTVPPEKKHVLKSIALQLLNREK